MLPEERKLKILEKLKNKQLYKTDDLARDLKVSRVTIQRDIKELVKKELVSKIHGGIKIIEEKRDSFETRFNLRLKINFNKKLEIAHKALNFVDDGSVIFIDTSTTCYVFAKELIKKKFSDLTIITNSPAIICEALLNCNIRIISTGGELRSDFNMLCGKWVVDFLENVNIDSSFISAAGISSKGSVTTSDMELASVLSVAIRKSKEINLLVDNTKFWKIGMLEICSTDKLKRIITDNDQNDALMKMRSKNLEII